MDELTLTLVAPPELQLRGRFEGLRCYCFGFVGKLGDKALTSFSETQFHFHIRSLVFDFFLCNTIQSHRDDLHETCSGLAKVELVVCNLCGHCHNNLHQILLVNNLFGEPFSEGFLASGISAFCLRNHNVDRIHRHQSHNIRKSDGVGASEPSAVAVDSDAVVVEDICDHQQLDFDLGKIFPRHPIH